MRNVSAWDSDGRNDFDVHGFLTVREPLRLEPQQRRRDELDGDDETEDEKQGITMNASMSTTRLGCSFPTSDSVSEAAGGNDVCGGTGLDSRSHPERRWERDHVGRLGGVAVQRT